MYYVYLNQLSKRENENILADIEAMAEISARGPDFEADLRKEVERLKEVGEYEVYKKIKKYLRL